jgi:hypothetical protein
MQRSVIRDQWHEIPDYASLHPSYSLRIKLAPLREGYEFFCGSTLTNRFLASWCFTLEKAVESTTSGYCTDKLRVFDDFLIHRMSDTISAKNHQKLSIYQHIRHSRYDSTAFSRFAGITIF